MRKRGKIITVLAVASILILLVTTGGLIAIVGPSYDYDHQYEEKEIGDGFYPRHFHLEWDASTIPLIPVVLHIWKLNTPRNLVINRSDITYLKRHEGFEKFRIDSLSVSYENGNIEHLISPEDDILERTFRISSDWKDRIIIEDAIRDRSGFIYRIKGESFNFEGEGFPFLYEVKYNYTWKFNLSTRFEYWAGI